MFARGEGYGIPFYRLWRKYKCYRQCKDGEPEAWEEDTSYTIRDTRVRRCWGFVAARAALIGLSVFLALQSMLPIHRGPLTPEQYAANVNDMCRILDIQAYERMDAEGNWVDDTPPNTYVLDLSGGSTPSHQLTLDESGHVTGVRIEVEQAGEKILFGGTTQQSLAALAFAAAQRSYNGISWWNSGVLQAIESRRFDDYTLQAGDVTITQTVEVRGYDGLDGGNPLVLLPSEDGEAPYYHLVFTLEQTT